ncbi:MAG TPA: translocation/assembly module TamB domain-containing protein [Candidatus Tectomicrobia bacterium]|nr:translocation/assembly module TamB domain-containing protein [Candidatus Tectomicrobia bacterium]
MVRKLLMIGGAVVLVFGLLLYAILAGLILGSARDAALQAVLRFVSNTLRGDVEVGSLQGSFLSSLVMRDIVVKDEQGRVIGQIDALRLSYDLLSLIRLRLTVHEIDIVHPRFTLMEEPGGVLNISRAFASAQPRKPETPKEPAAGFGLPVAIIIENLRLRDGEMALGLSALPGVRQVTGLQLRLQAQLDELGIQARLHHLTAETNPAQVDIHTMQGAFQSAAGAMRVDGLHLEMGHTVLTAQGALPHAQQPANFGLLIDPLDVAEIGRLLQQETLQGQLRLDVTVEGPLQALVAGVELHPMGNAARGMVAVQGEVNMLAKPVRYRGQVDVRQLDLTAVLNRPEWQSDLNLQVHLDGVGLAPHELESQVRVDIHPSHLGNIGLQPSQIDLQAQHGRFQVRRFDVETTMARMRATGAVDLSGRSDLQYELTADLSSLRQLLDEARLNGDVRLQGQASGEWPDLTVHGTLEVRDVQYQDYALDELRLTYQGTELGAEPKGITELRLQRARLGTIPVSQVELQGTYDGAARQVRFEVSVDQSPGNGMSTQGTLTLQKTEQRLDIEALQLYLAERIWQSSAPLQVIHSGDRLHLTPLRLVHAEESLEISGGIAGEELQDIRVQASQIDLSIVQHLTAFPHAVRGRATVQVRLAGTRQAPLLRLDLRLQPEGQQNLPFQDVQMSVSYAQQLLEARVRMQQTDREVLAVDLRVPVDMALTAIPPDQRLLEGPIALDVQLREPDLATFAGWYQGLPQLTGTVQGSIAVQGTAAQLGLTADLHLQQLGVVGTVEQLEGSLSMTGHLAAAPSIQALQHAVQRGDLTLTADSFELRIPALHGQLPGRQGPALPLEVGAFVLQADGQWSPIGMHATVQTLRLQARAFGLPQAELALEAGLTPERIDLQHLQVQLPQSEVRGRGSLTRADQQVQFQLEIPRLQLDEFPIPLPPDLPKQIQGTITANGSLRAPRVEARLTYAGARIAANLEAQWQEALPRYRAKLRVEALNIARLMPDLAGEFQASLQLQGSGFTAEERRATVDLALDSQHFGLAPGLTVRLQSTLAGDMLNLQELRVSSTPMQLAASGSLWRAREVELSYTLTLGDLTPLQQVVGAPLQASGTLMGKVRGPLNDLQTTGALDIKMWRYAEISGQGLEANFSASQIPSAPQGTIKVQVADVQAPSLPATSLRLEANYAPPQGRVTATVSKGPYQRTTLAGRVELNGGQHVTLDRLRLQHQELVWANEGPVEVRRTAEGDLSIQRFNLRSGAQRLRVTGHVGQAGALSADVQVQQLQIGPSVRAVMPEATVPEGQLSLDLTFTGTLQRPEGKGSLRLTSLAWQERALGEVRAAVELTDQQARTDLRWYAQGRELLQVEGSVGLSANGVLAILIRAPGLPLEMLQGPVPGLTHSAGMLNLDLRATGTLQQPRLNGSLTMENGALQLAATGERYRDIQMRIVMAGDRIDIQQLRVGSQSGPLEVMGWVQLAGSTLQQVDVTVRAREFTAMNTPGIQAVVDMDVAVRGSLQAMTATGTVTVPRLRVQVNKIPGTGPKAVQPWELTVEGVYGPGPGAVAAGGEDVGKPLQVDVPLPFLRADIRVEIPRNAWAQGPGTAVEISGDIQITKELERPFILSGGITVVRGFASVYGKRFVMKQGQVTFTGSPEINPLLDITINHTVSNYLVEIHVEGKAREPQLVFSSTPELPQTDILSLLIVGKTMDRLTSSEQQDLSSQLGGAAGSMVAGQLQEVIGGALGLDALTIGAGESFGGGSVGIGQYVTQDIFLSYEVGVGKGGGNRVGVEYSITPRLKLKGSTSDSGASTVDFLWRRDY